MLGWGLWRDPGFGEEFEKYHNRLVTSLDCPLNGSLESDAEEFEVARLTWVPESRIMLASQVETKVYYLIGMLSITLEEVNKVLKMLLIFEKLRDLLLFFLSLSLVLLLQFIF